MATKRVQIVELPVEHIERLLSGEITIDADLPADATLQNMWTEPPRQMICIMFESEEFRVVGEGQPAPARRLEIEPADDRRGALLGTNF